MDPDNTLLDRTLDRPVFDLPLRRETPDLLASRGGDPRISSTTGSAAEGLFVDLQRRFNPLVGREGYRALLQEAHRRAVRDHPVLERYPVSSRGNPFFGDLGSKIAEEEPAEVWSGLTALTGEFLDLAHALGRQGETIRRRPKKQAPSEPGHDIGDRVSRDGSNDVQHSMARSAVAYSPGRPWRVLVLDLDPDSCDRTARALCQAPDFEVRSRCTTVKQAREQLRRGRVEFIIGDSRFPSEELLDLCRGFRNECVEEPPHVVVTGLPQDPAVLLDFLEAGASAFTLEEFSVASLRLTLRLLARKESVFPLRLQHLMSLRVSELAELVRDRGVEPDLLWTLTAREGEILLLLEEDLTNREIARRLFISEGTVKSHVHQILKKLRVRDREEAGRILQFQRAAPGKLALTRSGFEREAERASASA